MTGRKLLMTFPVTADSHTLEAYFKAGSVPRCSTRRRVRSYSSPSQICSAVYVQSPTFRAPYE